MNSKLEDIYSKYLSCRKVSTDTRTIKEGDLFVALRGPSFNGNEYAESALKKGAKYALVDDPKLPKNPKFIVVENCLAKLQELSKYHRTTLDIPVLGITGSNGKTTTKELLIAVMSTKFKVSATKGNYNNHIGVPLTILNADRQADFLIVEMGTNQPGDIQELCEFADPNLGLITNIGASHLEKLGSKEGVFKDKSSLYHHVRSNKGTFFLNSGDQYLSRLDQPGRVINYSSEKGMFGQLQIKDNAESSKYLCFRISNDHTFMDVHTRMSGRYNLENVAAAMVVGHYFKVPINSMVQAIESYQPDNMRSQVMEKVRNSIILDAYNANPTSMRLSVNSFVEEVGERSRFFVLGDMLELGEHAENEHAQIVQLLKNLGCIDQVILVGRVFNSLQQDSFPAFQNVEDLIESQLLTGIRDKTILIKGSRGIQLERALDQL